MVMSYLPDSKRFGNRVDLTDNPTGLALLHQHMGGYLIPVFNNSQLRSVSG